MDNISGFARLKLKEDYILANCCHPEDGDVLIGYYSHERMIKVHRADCPNLAKADKGRLLKLEWKDIAAAEGYRPEEDYRLLDATDFRILAHHKEMGIDYSLAVAAILNLEQADVFARHTRLLEMKLLKRVAPVMVQYRKGVVKNKWIKHRNHTYYDLTEKGKKYLDYYSKGNE